MKNDVVIIENNKIYTSYFARASKIVPNRRLVSVSLGTPENWGGSYLRELNPPPSLLSDYKNNRIDEVEYERRYRLEVLDQISDSDRNKMALNLMGKVMCCWEKSGAFCHRTLAINWLEEGLGGEINGGEI